MQKIISHLWFDTEAKEAVDFYTKLFPDSKITGSSVLPNTPSGDVEVVSFELLGAKFQAISAGPYFKFTPAISFMVNFDPTQDETAQKRINDIWEVLVDGGKVLMPIGEYPFSECYGWVEDKYGVSWQLILTKPEGEERPLLLPSMLFVGDVCGKAEEATDFYISVFKNAKRGALVHYGENQEPNKEGTVMFTDFKLGEQWFVAMDSAEKHEFSFNEAVSFVVECDSQEEIDYFWEKLSAVPSSEQCGWVKDKYGVSWQIVPTVLGEMLEKGTKDQIARVTETLLKMKKLDIKALEEVFAEE